MAKKNNALRAASTLLVAVLLSTCAISGTFAKYVTSGSGTDSARVAKWGVEITATGKTFAESYAKDDNSFTLNANTVVSAENVVAPGTKGEMAAFTLTGTPETAFRVSFNGTMELGDKWVDATDTYYCPIEIKVGTTTFKGMSYASADEFETAVNAAIEAFSADYAAQTDLSTLTADDVPEISWSWPFESGNDVKDTYLGDKAAAGNAATISLSVTATVTQID
ncbi:MAG: hypothetical protein PUB97_11310 [Ruminococcus sp.]|nr:hypothetical protein [Ruminococcus sp.]